MSRVHTAASSVAGVVIAASFVVRRARDVCGRGCRVFNKQAIVARLASINECATMDMLCPVKNIVEVHTTCMEMGMETTSNTEQVPSVVMTPPPESRSTGVRCSFHFLNVTTNSLRWVTVCVPPGRPLPRRNFSRCRHQIHTSLCCVCTERVRIRALSLVFRKMANKVCLKKQSPAAVQSPN